MFGRKIKKQKAELEIALLKEQLKAAQAQRENYETATAATVSLANMLSYTGKEQPKVKNDEG